MKIHYEIIPPPGRPHRDVAAKIRRDQQRVRPQRNGKMGQIEADPIKLGADLNG